MNNLPPSGLSGITLRHVFCLFPKFPRGLKFQLLTVVAGLLMCPLWFPSLLCSLPSLLPHSWDHVLNYMHLNPGSRSASGGLKLRPPATHVVDIQVVSSFVPQSSPPFDLGCLCFDIPHIYSEAIWGSPHLLLRPGWRKGPGAVTGKAPLNSTCAVRNCTPWTHILLYTPCTFLLLICLPATHLIKISKMWDTIW